MLRFAVIISVVVYVHGSAIPELIPRFGLFGDERIIGGSPINIADAPYQVSFQWNKRHMCGGSIISETHVLSAGHCSAVTPSVEHLSVGSGSENLKHLQSHKVAKLTHHEKYEPQFLDFDVVVLKVATPFLFGATTKPIALTTTEPAANEPVVVTGWGAIDRGLRATDILNAVEVEIIDRDTCTKEYDNLNPVTRRMICAGLDAGGKDSCQGDSGGPLVSRKFQMQVGIASWGYGCAEPHYPGVYTNVANKEIQQFIQKQLEL